MIDVKTSFSIESSCQFVDVKMNFSNTLKQFASWKDKIEIIKVAALTFSASILAVGEISSIKTHFVVLIEHGKVSYACLIMYGDVIAVFSARFCPAREFIAWNRFKESASVLVVVQLKTI